MDWAWDKTRYKAARMVSLGGLTNDEIGKRLGVSARQIQRWKATPEFAREVDHWVGEWRKRVKESGAAVKEVRLARLNRRLALMDQVVRERAAKLAGKAPGGSTGLVICQLKSIGAGDESQVVEEFLVDTGILREMRLHEEQVAHEMGDWVDRKELSGPGGQAIPVAVTALAELFTAEELEGAKQKLMRAQSRS